MQLIRLIRRTVAEKQGFYLRRETCFVNPDAQKIIDRFIAPLKVDVLCGGDSSEREVSLKSGAAVSKALENCGYKVILTDLKKCEILPEMQDSDAVFPILHGGFGEGGELQDMLEQNLIKFVGSDSVASALIMDKIATKTMLDRFDLPTARWCVVDKEHRDFPEKLRLPFMVKAPREGSSVGIVKVENRSQWEQALEQVFEHADTLLVEEFVSGVELTVPVVNGKALDAIEIRAPHGFYDYDAKTGIPSICATPRMSLRKLLNVPVRSLLISTAFPEQEICSEWTLLSMTKVSLWSLKETTFPDLQLQVLFPRLPLRRGSALSV